MPRISLPPALGAALAGATLLLVPAPAGAVGVAVQANVLEVTAPRPLSGSSNPTGATVDPLSGGGAIVALYGPAPPEDLTAGAGCQQVSATGLAAPGLFVGSPHFAASCNLSGVVGVRGRLHSISNPQKWRSSLSLPTRITTATGTQTGSADTGDTIITGSGGDTIDAGGTNDFINPGGAPYKGQEAVPSATGEFQDPTRNTVNAGGGADKIELSFGLGRDGVTGGAGVDEVTYQSRFGAPGFPGQRGVDVTLNGQADDGDPTIDPPDSTAAGEGDNVGIDVENVIGTSREDVLTGNGSANRLEGREGKDTVTGLAGSDVVRAREPGISGLRDTLSCGSPPPPIPQQTFMGATIGGFSGGDSLDVDLLDVPPADCETVTQGAVREGPNVVVAATARRAARGRLSVRLRCPRAAGRTCAGTVRLAGRRGRGGPRTPFSIRRGRAATALVAPPGGAALPARGRRFTVRLVALERGRHGRVNTVAFARVPA
jgi:RTX calcium-binding nonapeptide repeat (4 copies)